MTNDRPSKIGLYDVLLEAESYFRQQAKVFAGYRDEAHWNSLATVAATEAAAALRAASDSNEEAIRQRVISTTPEALPFVQRYRPVTNGTAFIGMCAVDQPNAWGGQRCDYVLASDYDRLAARLCSSETEDLTADHAHPRRCVGAANPVSVQKSADALEASASEGLPFIQEPKYTVQNDRIVNRATGVAIPDNEPVFILRAKDREAVYALMDYRSRCLSNADHYHAIDRRIGDFLRFKGLHPQCMKQPDTAIGVIR